LHGFGGDQSSDELAVVGEDVVETSVEVAAFVERVAYTARAVRPVLDEGVEELAEWFEDRLFEQCVLGTEVAKENGFGDSDAFGDLLRRQCSPSLLSLWTSTRAVWWKRWQRNAWRWQWALAQLRGVQRSKEVMP
jgi:hypothetical protein